MYDIKKIPWPKNFFYEIYGPPSEDGMQMPEDIKGSVEYVIRTFLNELEEMIVRERYIECITIEAVAKHHDLTKSEVVSILQRIRRRFRIPPYSQYLVQGVQGAIKHNQKKARDIAYSDGYDAGYEAHKRKQNLEDHPISVLLGSVEYEHMEDIPSWRYDLERSKVDKIDLQLRSLNCLRRGQIEYVGQVMRMSDEELMMLPNLGDETLKEIRMKLDSFVKYFLKTYADCKW